MKNIWILNHYASSEGRHTFISHELITKGYNVTLFSSSFKHNNYLELKAYPKGKFTIVERDEGGFIRVWIKTISYSSNNYKRFLNQLDFAYKCYRAAKSLTDNKPDIVIGSSVHLFTGLTAYFLARKKKVPFIFEVRDLWPQTLIDLEVLPDMGFITGAFKRLEKFLYNKADHIISVLPNGHEYIRTLGIAQKKISHIPNGISLTWFDYNKNNHIPGKHIKDYFENKGNRLIFVYAGAFGLANGLDTLMQAIAILKSIEPSIYEKVSFLLVGDGPEKSKLEEMAKIAGLNNVFFTGSVDRKEVPWILTKSDVCLSIVRYSRVHRYGISMNKLFDYLASAKPLISAQAACFDLVDLAGCGITLKPDDPEKLAFAIKDLAMLTELKRAELGQKAREYVKENHDYIDLTTKLIDLFDELMNSKTKKSQVRFSDGKKSF